MLQYVKLGVQFTQRLCITDLTVSPFVSFSKRLTQCGG
jgi:hypothetical protein